MDTFAVGNVVAVERAVLETSRVCRHILALAAVEIAERQIRLACGCTVVARVAVAENRPAGGAAAHSAASRGGTVHESAIQDFHRRTVALRNKQSAAACQIGIVAALRGAIAEGKAFYRARGGCANAPDGIGAETVVFG